VRARVSERDGKWTVVWGASRVAYTEAEARALATLPEPPPARKSHVDIPPEFAAGIVKLHRLGLTPKMISDGLNWAGVQGVRGGSWHPATVRNVLRRAEEADERARRTEWTTDKDPLK